MERRSVFRTNRNGSGSELSGHGTLAFRWGNFSGRFRSRCSYVGADEAALDNVDEEGVCGGGRPSHEP